MDYYAKYVKYKTKYFNLVNSPQSGFGHSNCKKCNCVNFIAENFNQHCNCTHSYKEHALTISDWMIQIYNMDKSIKNFMK